MKSIVGFQCSRFNKLMGSLCFQGLRSVFRSQIKGTSENILRGWTIWFYLVEIGGFVCRRRSIHRLIDLSIDRLSTNVLQWNLVNFSFFGKKFLVCMAADC